MLRHAEKRQQLRAELQKGHDLPDLTVAQIMTLRPTCVDLRTTALELVQMFFALQVRHFLVINDAGELVGLVSDRDVGRCFGPQGASAGRPGLECLTCEEFMSTDLLAVVPTTNVKDAVETMLSNGVNCLPVVSGKKPVGVVTSTDLQLLLINLLSRERKPLTV